MRSIDATNRASTVWRSDRTADEKAAAEEVAAAEWRRRDEALEKWRRYRQDAVKVPRADKDPVQVETISLAAIIVWCAEPRLALR